MAVTRVFNISVCMVALVFLSGCVETDVLSVFQSGAEEKAELAIEKPVPTSAAIAPRNNDRLAVGRVQRQNIGLRYRIDASGVPVPGMKPKKAIVIAKRARVDSEDLLAAEGRYTVVEKTRDYDPAEAHMKAREKVDVRRRSKDRELAAHFEPDAKSGQDGKTRVLELKRARERERERDRAGGTFLDAVSSVFSSEEPEAGTEMDIIVPPDVPKRKDVRKSVMKSSGVVISESGVVIPKRKPLSPRKDKRAALKRNSRERNPYTKAIYNQDDEFEAKPIVYNHDDSSGVKPSILGLRTGVHPDKTRVVIDITKPTGYKAVIDPLRKVLRVQLENVHWHIPDKGKPEGGARLLGSYVARENGESSYLLEVRLTRKAELVYTEILEPNFSSKYRIVIDLKPL